MQEIGQVIGELQTTEERKQRGRDRILTILADEDVKAFIAEHHLDKAKVKESMSRFNEYWLNKRDKPSKPPELRYNDGQVQVYYPPVEFTP